MHKISASTTSYSNKMGAKRRFVKNTLDLKAAFITSVAVLQPETSLRARLVSAKRKLVIGPASLVDARCLAQSS